MSKQLRTFIFFAVTMVMVNVNGSLFDTYSHLLQETEASAEGEDKEKQLMLLAFAHRLLSEDTAMQKQRKERLAQLFEKRFGVRPEERYQALANELGNRAVEQVLMLFLSYGEKLLDQHQDPNEGVLQLLSLAFSELGSQMDEGALVLSPEGAGKIAYFNELCRNYGVALVHVGEFVAPDGGHYYALDGFIEPLVCVPGTTWCMKKSNAIMLGITTGAAIILGVAALIYYRRFRAVVGANAGLIAANAQLGRENKGLRDENEKLKTPPSSPTKSAGSRTPSSPSRRSGSSRTGSTASSSQPTTPTRPSTRSSSSRID